MSTLLNKPDSDEGERQSIPLGCEIIATILWIIKEGWERTLSELELGPNDGEVRLTERLRTGMREAANEIEMELAVLPGTESLSRPDMDRPDGRISRSF